MKLAEQARVAQDQMVLNRVAQACITVALERRGFRSRRIRQSPDVAAKQAVRFLAATSDGWLSSDAELLEEIRRLWGKL